MNLFSEVELSAAEIRAVVRGLYAIALVDGLHEREVRFISDLVGERPDDVPANDAGKTPAPAPPSWAQLTPLEPLDLAALLPTSTHRKLFLKSAYLLAWADGKVSFAERSSIDAFASALGVATEHLARLEAEVKDQVLS